MPVVWLRMVRQGEVKPPYRVPSMTDIRNIEWNGFRAAGTFSGGGGSTCGYRMAGFRVLYANEFIPAAYHTYRRNHPGSVVDPRDIRKVMPQDVCDACGVRPGELDLLDGSPPCAAFSTAGKRERDWGKVKRYSDTEQRVDDLFFEFARLVDGIRPKTFVAENVSGLVKGTAKGYFKAILQRLRACGYQVEARLLNASWLGVPQARERIIFVGVRSDLGLQPVFPAPMPYRYTVRDALENVPAGVKHYLKPGLKTLFLYHHTKPGDNMSEAHGRFYGNVHTWHSHVRLSWDKPSPTVLQAKAQIYHPDEARPLTIPEVKRICSYPDDYMLTGSYGQQWERCGRSVPPVMMSQIATAIRDGILRKL